MKKYFMMMMFSLALFTQMNNVFANEEFIAEQRDDFDTISPEDALKIRHDIEAMATRTLENIYKEKPELQEKIKKAYGYGVFEGQAINLIMYVAGNGLGVVYDNKTHTPVYMNVIRAGTGPGIGYKSVYGIVIFDNELVYEQFTTIGLQVSASGDAAVKVAGIGVGDGGAISLVPGVSLYQVINNGLVLQANWGATEFLKDPHLNQ